MASEFFGRDRECPFYTAGCGNKMTVSVNGPRAVNELGGPVIPGSLGGSTPRHAQTAGDLGLAVQFNAETPWKYLG